MIKPLLKVAAVAILFFLVLYALMWIPVVDGLVRWCSYYPNSLEDCKELI